MWTRIRQFFSDSEVIFLARLQMFIGALAGILATIDPNLVAPIIPAEWFPWYLLISGIITEVARRMRDEEM